MRALVAGFARVSDVLSEAASPASCAPPRFKNLARCPRLNSYAQGPSSLAPLSRPYDARSSG
jgi:hypothetical protein